MALVPLLSSSVETVLHGHAQVLREFGSGRSGKVPGGQALATAYERKVEAEAARKNIGPDEIAGFTRRNLRRLSKSNLDKYLSAHSGQWRDIWATVNDDQ